MPLTDTRPPCRIAVLISGRGSNLQSIIDAIASRKLAAIIAVVVSNRADAAGLQRGRDAGIEALHLSPRDYPDRDAYDRAIVRVLQTRNVNLVCLAGFMRLVGLRATRWKRCRRVFWPKSTDSIPTPSELSSRASGPSRAGASSVRSGHDLLD